MGILMMTSTLLCASLFAPQEQPNLLLREMNPVYLRWFSRPGAMLNFWMGDPMETKERTGSTAATDYFPMLAALRSGPVEQDGVSWDWSFLGNKRGEIRVCFDAERPFSSVAFMTSTALSGAASAGVLHSIGADGAETVVCEAKREGCEKEPMLTFSPATPAPAGGYSVTITATRFRVDVWPGEAAVSGARIEDPLGTWSKDGYILTGVLTHLDGSQTAMRKDDIHKQHIPVGLDSLVERYATENVPRAVCVGEHNNPFFVRYPPSFFEAHPEARMLDRDGKVIGINGNPQVPYDDPTLTRLSSDFTRRTLGELAPSPHVAYWVMGGEQMFPDGLGLTPGDFRPASMAHYEQYLKLRRWDIPASPENAFNKEHDAAWNSWWRYRERAAADRAAIYMGDFLSVDPSRPVLYPTCGHPFAGELRRLVTHPVDLFAGAMDGFETGQITIDEDVERLNPLTMAHFSGYGVPVATPRLANKTLDPTAQGGGKTFTPHMLRRLVMECVGYGASHVGMVEWAKDLFDGEWRIKGTPAEDEARRVFGELNIAAPILEGMGRLQPRISIFVSGAEWLAKGWDPRWTCFFQDALAMHWNPGIISDGVVDASFARRTPVIVSIGNEMMTRIARDGLAAYLAAGGCVIAYGPFGEKDELGRPLEWTLPGDPAARLIRRPLPEGGKERTINSLFHTGEGAGSWVRTCRAVPVADVLEAVNAVSPGMTLAPIRVEGQEAGEVDVFPLTDGVSTLAIVINRAAAPREITLIPDGKLRTVKGAWEMRPLTSGQAPTPWTEQGMVLTLEAHATAMIWLHPLITHDLAAHSVEDVEKVIQRWRELGCDVASQARLLEGAKTALAISEYGKAWALTESIRRMPGAAVSMTRGEGVIQLRAKVYSASGAVIPDSRVTCRVVPGSYLWRPLSTPDASGEARLDIPESELATFYNPASGSYNPPARFRVVFAVSTSKGESGAIVSAPG